ncbi:hypothetical protein NC652_016555 [Populus alba x Populus x berolinensis]|nr:hypothetical protein NC652_016555 [Populus alba x Populus x berolinensis]
MLTKENQAIEILSYAMNVRNQII